MTPTAPTSTSRSSSESYQGRYGAPRTPRVLLLALPLRLPPSCPIPPSHSFPRLVRPHALPSISLHVNQEGPSTDFPVLDDSTSSLVLVPFDCCALVLHLAPIGASHRMFPFHHKLFHTSPLSPACLVSSASTSVNLGSRLLPSLQLTGRRDLLWTHCTNTSRGHIRLCAPLVTVPSARHISHQRAHLPYKASRKTVLWDDPFARIRESSSADLHGRPWTLYQLRRKYRVSASAHWRATGQLALAHNHYSTTRSSTIVPSNRCLSSRATAVSPIFNPHRPSFCPHQSLISTKISMKIEKICCLD